MTTRNYQPNSGAKGAGISLVSARYHQQHKLAMVIRIK